MEAWDVDNIFQLEEMFACGGVNVDMNLAIAFYIRIAIAGENGVNPI
jgi:TPR repeat protein